ncbi:MAG: RNA polymerase sigma-70 factor [Chitinophagaceae bacterium]|nr:RNA polymerase sigma-70 factor [Chitinophagaceae bacterium]
MPDAEQYRAFQVVFDTYYNALCNYAYSYLKDEDACEDIVQEVFTRIWEHRANLIGTEEIRYYLFTAVRNNCISQLRKEKKNSTVQWESGSPEYIQDKAEYIQDKEEREKDYRAAIQKAIEGLPPRCREVFLLSRISNMTYKEIAKSLDISEKTVENQIGKALKLIRASLVNIFL